MRPLERNVRNGGALMRVSHCGWCRILRVPGLFFDNARDEFRIRVNLEFSRYS